MNARVSLPVLFWCMPLSARLTRRSCGAQHLSANAPHKRGDYAKLNPPCRDCAIGKVHASGGEPTQWPNGAPITVVGSLDVPPPTATKPPSPVPSQPSRPIRPAELPINIAAKEPVMPESTNAKKYSRAGRSLSLREWARVLGVTDSALRIRIKKGWPIERVLSTGRTTAHASGQAGGATRRGGPRDRVPDRAAARTKRPPPAPLRRASRSEASVLPRDVQPPDEVLRQLGYLVTSAMRVPSGLALIVEVP